MLVIIGERSFKSVWFKVHHSCLCICEIKEVIASKESVFWKDAIQDEMDLTMSNHTWKLVDLPKGSRSIGCKWVFRIKYNSDGTINTYTSRLMTKDFRQNEGVHHFDTYALVASTTKIRVLFALAFLDDLIIYQIDVKIIFLNRDLGE